MASLLKQLPDRQAILLMYLAEELGAEDRREVEEMLRGDASLAAELEEIRAAQIAVMAAIGALDQSAPLAVSTPVVVRQVSRLMKQWQVDRLARPAAEAQKKGPRFPWWAYPAASAAAAACVLIALMVWWGMKPDNGPIAGTPATAPAIAIATDDQGSQQSQDGQGDLQISDENSGLAGAEQQASALVRRSDDGAVIASIFMTEPVQ
jgi:hypothetical protein